MRESSPNLRVTRREFFQLGVGMLYAGYLALRHPIELFARSVESENSWKIAEEFLKHYPLYQPLMSSGIPEFGNVRFYNASDGRRLRPVVGLGAYPTIQFVDEDRIPVHLYPKIPFTNILLSEVVTELLFVPKRGNNPCRYNETVIKEVVVLGDSFISWGGNIYSPAHLLQEFLSIDGHDLTVRDVSLPSAGPLHMEHAYRRLRAIHKNTDGPHLILHAYEPANDLLTDTYFFHHPEERRQYPPKQISDLIHDAGALTIRRIRANLGLDTRGNEPAPVPTDLNNSIVRESIAAMARVRANAPETYTLVGLPSNLIKSKHARAYSEFFESLCRAIGLNQHLQHSLHETYPAYEYDHAWHPTPNGALIIAANMYNSVIGSYPTESTRRQVLDNMYTRLELMPRITEQLQKLVG